MTGNEDNLVRIAKTFYGQYVVIINEKIICRPMSAKDVDKLIDDIYEAIGNLASAKAETKE